MMMAVSGGGNKYNCDDGEDDEEMMLSTSSATGGGGSSMNSSSSRPSTSLVEEYEKRRRKRKIMMTSRIKQQHQQHQEHNENDNDLEEPLLLPQPQQQPEEVVVEPPSPSNSQQQQQQQNQQHPVSRNVTLCLIYTCILQIGRSVWSQSVLATFVFLLENNNPEDVGYVTAALGISQLVTSFPSGYLADSYRRDTLLKLASVFGIVAVCITVHACYRQSFIWLVAALSSWGAFFGISSPSLMALFTDSIPNGQRTKYFTLRSQIRVLGNTAGPIVALLMFHVLGNHWTKRDCSVVIIIGQCITLPAALLLCFFSDDYHHVAASESESTTTDNNNNDGIANDEQQLQTPLLVDDNNGQQQPQSSSTTTTNNTSNSEVVLLLEKSDPLHRQESGTATTTATTTTQLQQSCSELQDGEEAVAANAVVSSSSSDTTTTTTTRLFFGCVPQHRVIPVFVATADLLSGLGSGMSIRYFPIFFVDNLKLGPVLVQLLYVVFPILMVALMHAARIVSKKYYGRMVTTVAFKWIGISLMILMIVAYKLHLPTWIVCCIYVMRTAFMNSPGALTRSALMDNVPKHERGKWAALESVNMFSWSGSAVLGGFLVGKIGMLPLFGVTATIQFIATLPLMVLFGKVDKKEEEQGRTDTAVEETAPSSAVSRDRTLSSNGTSTSSLSTSSDDESQ